MDETSSIMIYASPSADECLEVVVCDSASVFARNIVETLEGYGNE